MDSCNSFRTHLRSALEERSTDELGLSHGGRPLAWHEHLFACASCRALLQAEEVLEDLLASLPEPRLPVALAQRVLARLSRLGELAVTDRNDEALDAALDVALGGQALAPSGLAGRVLAGLEQARDQAETERRLELLLERVPEPEVPAGLAERVLAGVRTDQLLDKLPTPNPPADLPERVLAATRPAPILRPRFGRWAASAAAALVLVFAATRLFGTGDETPNSQLNVARNEVESPNAGQTVGLPGGQGPSVLTPQGDLAASGEPLPDLELLESLDVLEDWELLMSDDLDLLLGSLGDVDRELLLAGGIEEEQG